MKGDVLPPLLLVLYTCTQPDNVVGVGLSKPHTSETALRTCVYIYVYACLLAAVYRKLLKHERIQITKIKLMHSVGEGL